MTTNWLIDIKLPKTISTHPPELVGTKYSGGIVDYGLKGEKGVEGTRIERRNKRIERRNKRVAQKMSDVFNWSSYKKNDGTLDWDKLGFTDGIKSDRKEPLISSAQLMYDYVTSNNIVTKIGNVNMAVIIFQIIRKVIENSNSSLENPESFYAYCVEFVRKVLPHYENVNNKLKKERDELPQQCIDIEAQVCHDISQNVIEILNKEDI